MPEADWRQHDGHTAPTSMAVVTVAAIAVVARRCHVISGAAIVVVADARGVMSVTVPTVMASEIVVATEVLLIAMVTITTMTAPVVAVRHGDTAERQCECSKYRTEGFHGSYSW